MIDFEYTDDEALLSNDEDELQHLLDKLTECLHVCDALRTIKV